MRIDAYDRGKCMPMYKCIFSIYNSTVPMFDIDQQGKMELLCMYNSCFTDVYFSNECSFFVLKIQLNINQYRKAYKSNTKK